MEELEKKYNLINRNDTDKWVLKHPNPTFDQEILIPSQYLTNSEHQHEGGNTCKIHFVFDFFTDGDNSKEGDELYATKFRVIKEASSNTGKIRIEIIGNLKYKRPVGDPSGIPQTASIPGAGITPTITDPEPFDPNIEIPQSVIGDPTAPVEPGGSHIEVPVEPPIETPIEIPSEVPAEIPVEIPVEPPVEPPIEPTEPPVEPKEPGNNEDEDE